MTDFYVKMSSYAGLDEQGLRKLLDTSSDITERRQIRAALRELRANNNNIGHPHFRTPISPSKLSHHQSFRSERRRRPETDAIADGRRHSQDDDVLYRSRRRREMERGRGGGDDGDDENEEKVDIDVKIREIGNDELKLTKLLSETRDFGDRRKVRSAIREIKRKTRQDELDTLTKNQQKQEENCSVQHENHTNAVLSRTTNDLGQKSSETSREYQSKPVSSRSTLQERDQEQKNKNQQDLVPTISNSTNHRARRERQSDVVLSRSANEEGQRSLPRETDNCEQSSREKDIDEEIVALQKKIEITKTYEERRRIRGEIRELRQKKNGYNNSLTQHGAQKDGVKVDSTGPTVLIDGREDASGSKVNTPVAEDQDESGGAQQVEDEDWDEDDDNDKKGEEEEAEIPHASLENQTEGDRSEINTHSPTPTETKTPSKDSDSGFAEPHYYDTTVTGNELSNTSNDTDIPDIPELPVNPNEDDKTNVFVDMVGNKTQQGSNAGYNNTVKSTHTGNHMHDYEIIPDVELPDTFINEQSTLPGSTEIISSETLPDLTSFPPPPPPLVDPPSYEDTQSPDFPKELNMSWTRQAVKCDESDSVRNLLPSQIKKKQQNGPCWLKENASATTYTNKSYRKENEETGPVRNLLPSEIKKKQTCGKVQSPQSAKTHFAAIQTKKSQTLPSNVATSAAQNKAQTLPANTSIEVVKRPEGSRRARIIRSFLELERIKREGPGAVDPKSIQITQPSLLANGNGVKAVSGAGGGLGGSDQMLEDMINLQLLQAMGVNPHAIAAGATPAANTPQPATRTVPTSAGPQRPSHLEIPAPIKCPSKGVTKPLKPNNGPVKGSGPSKGIAQMMNRFGGGVQPSSQKHGFQGTNSTVKPSFGGNAWSSSQRSGFSGSNANIKPSSMAASNGHTAPFVKGSSGTFPRGQASPFSKGSSPSPFGKGLKKSGGGQNAFNIEVNGDDVEISLKDGSQLMNMFSSPRGKGK